MDRKLLVLGSIFGLMAVLFGAFGAHGLKELISAESIQTFETGVRYQMYHALLLLFVGITGMISVKSKRWIFYFVAIGVFFFSGSIYALATNNLTSFDFRTIAFITPIGGLMLIVSWLLLISNFVKIKK